jgi:hypothetical protein
MRLGHFDRRLFEFKNASWKEEGEREPIWINFFRPFGAFPHGLCRGLLLSPLRGWSVADEPLGLRFAAPVLGLATDDCVTLAGRTFQLPAVDNGYGAPGVFDKARFLKNSRCHRHARPPRS